MSKEALQFVQLPVEQPLLEQASRGVYVSHAFEGTAPTNAIDLRPATGEGYATNLLSETLPVVNEHGVQYNPFIPGTQAYSQREAHLQTLSTEAPATAAPIQEQPTQQTAPRPAEATTHIPLWEPEAKPASAAAEALAAPTMTRVENPTPRVESQTEPAKTGKIRAMGSTALSGLKNAKEAGVAAYKQAYSEKRQVGETEATATAQAAQPQEGRLIRTVGNIKRRASETTLTEQQRARAAKIGAIGAKAALAYGARRLVGGTHAQASRSAVKAGARAARGTTPANPRPAAKRTPSRIKRLLGSGIAS